MSFHQALIHGVVLACLFKYFEIEESDLGQGIAGNVFEHPQARSAIAGYKTGFVRRPCTMSSPAEHPSMGSNFLKEIGPGNSSGRRSPQRALLLWSITGYGTRPIRPSSWWLPHNPRKRRNNSGAILKGTVSEPESLISSLPANPAFAARVQKIGDMLFSAKAQE